MRASGPTTTPGLSASAASSDRSFAARSTISPDSPFTFRGPRRLTRTAQRYDAGPTCARALDHGSTGARPSRGPFVLSPDRPWLRHWRPAMTDFVVTAPHARHWLNRTLVAVALLLAAIVVAIALFWTTGGSSKPVNHFKIPQS